MSRLKAQYKLEGKQGLPSVLGPVSPVWVLSWFPSVLVAFLLPWQKSKLRKERFVLADSFRGLQSTLAGRTGRAT